MNDDEAGPFFFGAHENRLNAKDQVALPAALRAMVPETLLPEGFVLLPGGDDCLYLYTRGQFARIKRRVRERVVATGESEFLRMFLESAHPVVVDGQGRFVVPAPLRNKAGLEGPGVLFLGMDDRIEIWDPEKRRARRGDEADYEARRRAAARQIFEI